MVYDSLLLFGVGYFSRGYYIIGKSDKLEVGIVMQYVTHLANMEVQTVAHNNWSVWKFDEVWKWDDVDGYSWIFYIPPSSCPMFED